MTPAFIIEPMDEEYEISENLFRFDEAEFNEKIRCTGFAANEGDVDMVLKMRSLIYSQNLFLCVWNIRADALIKYISIFIRMHHRKCSMLFLSKEIGSYLPVILLMMKPLMNFYQLEQKILVSWLSCVICTNKNVRMNISWSLMLQLINLMRPIVMMTIPKVEYPCVRIDELVWRN